MADEFVDVLCVLMRAGEYGRMEKEEEVQLLMKSAEISIILIQFIKLKQSLHVQAWLLPMF